MHSLCCRLLVVVLMGLLSRCDSASSVPPGRIRVKNDFWGEEYSTIKVSARGARYTLKSKESVLLPAGTTTIEFSYSDQKYTRRYRVECPSQRDKGITINLLDVHLNKIAGGCETVWAEKN